MPTLTRRSSSTVVKRVKASEPIVIDLDDEDVPVTAAPVPAEYLLVEEEEDVKGKVKPAKKAASRRKAAPKRAQEAASMPVESEPVADMPRELPLRRAVTLPIQLRSRTTTALSESSEIEASPIQSETSEVANKMEETEENEESSVKPNGFGAKTAPALTKQRSKGEALESPTPTPPPPKDSISRQATAILSAYVPQSSSTPAKLPSSNAIDTTSSTQQSPPNKLSSSSSSSLFRYRDSIDVQKVKSVSTLDEIDIMKSSTGSDSATTSKKAAPHVHSFQEMLSDIIDLDQVEEEEEDADIFSGPSPKKQCGPGRKAANVYGVQTIKKQPTATKVAEPTHYNPYDLVEDSYMHSSVPRPSTSKSVKSTSPKKPARTSSADADALLGEVLGIKSTPDKVATPATSSYASVSKNYSDYTSILAKNRQFLSTSQSSKPPPAYPTAASPYPRSTSSAAASYSPNFKVHLKVGAKILDVIVYPSDTIEEILKKLTKDKQLPAPLPREEFIIKFDGRALEAKDTVKASLMAAGDTLVLSALRDGKEDPKAFDAMKPEEEGEGGDGADGSKIMLCARFSDGSSVNWRIDRDQPLFKLAKAAATRLGVPVEKIKVKFDGSSLNLAHTPEDAELEDEDMVDISVKS